MIILGITDGDDSGAVIYSDGELVAAVNEERLNRMKLVMGFPYLSIEEVLRISGLERGQIDLVAVGALVETFNAEPKPNLGWFAGDESTSKRYQLRLASSMASIIGRFSQTRAAYHKLKSFLRKERQNAVRRAIAEDLGIGAPVEFYPHHICHGLSGYGGSGFGDAVELQGLFPRTRRLHAAPP